MGPSPSTQLLIPIRSMQSSLTALGLAGGWGGRGCEDRDRGLEVQREEKTRKGAPFMHRELSFVLGIGFPVWLL